MDYKKTSKSGRVRKSAGKQNIRFPCFIGAVSCSQKSLPDPPIRLLMLAAEEALKIDIDEDELHPGFDLLSNIEEEEDEDLDKLADATLLSSSPSSLKK